MNKKKRINKKKKEKKNLFNIEKILDKKEYEEGHKKGGQFPIELQRQIFFNNMLKIMKFKKLEKCIMT